MLRVALGSRALQPLFEAFRSAGLTRGTLRAVPVNRTLDGQQKPRKRSLSCPLGNDQIPKIYRSVSQPPCLYETCRKTQAFGLSLVSAY